MQGRSLVFALTGLFIAHGASANRSPITVSPGGIDGLAAVESRCPTFSWSAVEDAAGYQLVVYGVGEKGEQTEPVLDQRFQGAVTTWTPSLELCLERGRQYAWSILALGTRAAEDWSQPRLFRVVSEPTREELERALDLVRRYLGRDGEMATGIVTDPSSTPTSAPGQRSGKSAAGAPAVTQLSVDGNVDAVTYTGDGSNLVGVTTGVTAGTGLLGGGASGPVTLDADPAYLQRRVAGVCAPDSSIREIDAAGAVTCEPDTDTDTTYTAGLGLNLSGTTFAADTTALQARVATTCPVDSAIRAIDASGGVTCETDTDTTYSAGAGLNLSGTTFAADTTALQARVAGTCPAGSAIRIVDASGAVTCEPDTDTNTTYSAGDGLGLTGTSFSLTAFDYFSGAGATGQIHRSGNVALGTFTDPDGHGLNVQNYSSQKAAVRGADQSGVNLYAEGQLGILLSSGVVPKAVTNAGVLGIKHPLGANGVAVYGWNNDDNTENFAGVFIADGTDSGSLDVNYGVYAEASNAAGANYAGYFVDNILIEQSEAFVSSGSSGITLDRGDGDRWKTKHTGLHYSFIRNNSRLAYVNGASGAYVQVSDRRRKEGIESLGPVLERVERLAPVRYHFVGETGNGPKSIGLVAQEVGEIFPELLRVGEDGTYGLAYSDLAVLAIAALQEQQRQIESLEESLRELRRRATLD